MHAIREQLTEIQKKIKLYLSVNRFDAAEKLIHAALADFGPLANMHFFLGLTHHRQSRFPDAIREFHQAIQLNPNYTEAILCLAATLCDLGQYDDAQKLFRQAKEKLPKGRQAPDMVLGRIANQHAENAKLYDQAGMTHEAIQEYRRALALYPNMPDIKLILAKLYLKTGEFALAQGLLEDILAQSPQELEPKTLLGLVLFKQNQLEKARQLWRAVQIGEQHEPVARAYLRLLEATPLQLNSNG